MQIKSKRHVRGNRRELLRHHHLLALLLQRFAIALIRNFLRALKRLFHVAVFLDQIGGALFADALCAGNIVDGVAHQGHHVDHLLGWHAQNFLDLGLIHDDVTFGAARTAAQDADVFVDKLHHVLVIRDEQDVQIFLCSLLGQRPDHVVGFIALVFEDRQPQRFAQPPHMRDLRRELLRHRRPLRFVLLK